MSFKRFARDLFGIVSNVLVLHICKLTHPGVL